MQMALWNASVLPESNTIASHCFTFCPGFQQLTQVHVTCGVGASMTNRNVVTGSAATFSDHDLAIPTDSARRTPQNIAKSTPRCGATRPVTGFRRARIEVGGDAELFGGREA